MADKTHLKNLEQRLLDDGLLMEAGWIGFRIVINNHHKVSAEALGILREAFFAGAQHVFSSVVRSLEEDQEPTDNDMRRMDMLLAELQEFDQAFRLKYQPAKGSS